MPEVLCESREVHYHIYVVEKFTGIVKWYNEAKGFGFIEQSNGRDLFVHYKEVRGKLNQGDKVEYELGEAKQGPCACKVKILESSSAGASQPLATDKKED